MAISIAALIIALASLMWNVISTAYSWKFSKPAIKIITNARWTREKDWLVVNVVNTGGSAVAIRELQLYWWFAKGKARSNPHRATWLLRTFWKIRRRIYRITRKPPKAGLVPPLSKSINNPEEGPDFPHTIPPYHNQVWSFDDLRLMKLWEESSIRTKNFLIEVRLSNGKRVTHKTPAFFVSASNWSKDKNRGENNSLPD